VRIDDEPHCDDHRCDDRETLAAAHRCQNGTASIGSSRRWTAVNRKHTGNGAVIILIAIETISRPADRPDDDAYSTEPDDLMNVVAGDDRNRVGNNPDTPIRFFT
jgi:hypothetical protein